MVSFVDEYRTTKNGHFILLDGASRPHRIPPIDSRTMGGRGEAEALVQRLYQFALIKGPIKSRPRRS